MRPRKEFLSLEVPGLAEGRPSVLTGDKIIVTHPNCNRYEGFVHEVRHQTYNNKTFVKHLMQKASERPLSALRER